MPAQPPITRICEAVEAAHARIQADFPDINPIVSVNHRMRTVGIASDIMTIDCLKSGKRILLIFHDAEPDMVSFQLCRCDSDPSDHFEALTIDHISEQTLYEWMRDSFNKNRP